MLKYFLFIALLAINCISNPDSDFDIFLKDFFENSSFQINRVTFPYHGLVCFPVDTGSGTACIDTILTQDSSQWEHMEYANGNKGAIHKIIYPEGKSKSTLSDGDLVTVEFELPETCFNLTLYFRLNAGKWRLINQREFVL